MKWPPGSFSTLSEGGLHSRRDVPLANRVPTVADYRRQAAVRERWHAAGAVLFVIAVATLVFWLLPPSAAAPGRAGSTAASSNGTGT